MQRVTPSAIREIFSQIETINAERTASGLDPLIDLSIGQPHLPPNPNVIKALASHINQATYEYSSPQGKEKTLNAIARLYTTYFFRNLSFSTDEVMVTNGASQALWNAFSILIKHDDVVIAFEPYFSTYRSQIETLGGRLALVRTAEREFRPNADALDHLLTSEQNAKVVILNFPNNPSGITLTADEAEQIAIVLRKHPHIAIIIDDVYRTLNHDPHITLLDVAPDLKNRCIIVNSCAKGLAGAPDLRAGMALAKPEWIKQMCDKQLITVSSVSSLTQMGLVEAIDDHLNNPDQSWSVASKKEYLHNITVTANELKKYGLRCVENSSGVFYLLMKAKHLIGREITAQPELLKQLGTKQIRHDVDLVYYFIHVAGVATVPGSGFGIKPTDGYIRLSCTQPADQLILAANRLGKAAALLKQPAITANHVTPWLNANLVPNTKDMPTSYPWRSKL